MMRQIEVFHIPLTIKILLFYDLLFAMKIFMTLNLAGFYILIDFGFWLVSVSQNRHVS